MKATTSITIDKELLLKLDIRAKSERRTRSNMTEVIFEEALKEIEIPKK